MFCRCLNGNPDKIPAGLKNSWSLYGSLPEQNDYFNRQLLLKFPLQKN